MHKHNQLLAKCASGILSFSLIMSMIPSVPAWAEEDFSDDGYVDEEALDEAEAETEEENSLIFYITKFTDFEKDSEGHFTNEQTKEKYGDLKAEPGTALEDLNLPEKLTVEGYWESDGSDVISSITLENIIWKLKSDNDAEYTESSPEGTYTFVPDYEAYVMEYEDLDGLLLADGVKDLTIDVQIVAVPEENESETETETETETESETALLDTDDTAEDIVSDTSDSNTEDSEDIALATPDSNADVSGGVSLDTSEAATDDGDVNIFDNLDDSLIDTGSVEEYKDSGDGVVTLLPENSDSQSVVTDGSEDSGSQNENSNVSNNTSSDDAVQNTNTDASQDTSADASQDANTDASGIVAPQETVAQTLSGSLVFRNSGDDTVIYQYPSDTSSTVSFTAGEVTSLTSVQLPCNAALNSLSIKFVLSDGTAYDLTQADFSDGATKRITFTDGTNAYSLDLALTKAAHNYDAATCQHLATCQNCGATTGDYADHVSANNETCTKNATCSVCGAELEGTALGHDWEPATCTTPKTCTRCGATEGAALGHDLRDDWETVEESTYSSHGYQERYCHRDSCDYSESRDLNIVGNPTDNAIQNLSEGATYDINSRLTFSAYGAASENTSPIDNDIRYIPSTWSIQNTAGTWLDNYSGAFSISKTGTYTVTVTFQKQVYGDGSWQNTDIADSKSVTFSIGGASTDGSNDAVRINPQTGDQTQILPFVIILAGAAIVIIVILVLRKKKKQ